MDYEVNGTDWKLSVSDNGIGRGTGSAPPAKGGLGTSLVKALAHQLDAQVETVSGPGGMRVSVTHATFVSRTTIRLQPLRNRNVLTVLALHDVL